MATDRSVDRRSVLKVLGASGVVPVLARLGPGPLHACGGSDPPVPFQGQDGQSWVPRFFTAHENDTVTLVSELIIPRTDTPGARAARVNQYIDEVLADENTEARARDVFRQGLAWLDEASRARFGRAFIEADPAEQTALLMTLASPEPGSPPSQTGIDFFNDIKRRTIEGYYGSEVGMFDELAFQGNTVLDEFDGCTHPEHLNWEPAAGDGARRRKPDA